MINPIENQEITQTENVLKWDNKVKEQGFNEFERLMLCQHDNVI
jgi:serine/threonine protein kinase